MYTFTAKKYKYDQFKMAKIILLSRTKDTKTKTLSCTI